MGVTFSSLFTSITSLVTWSKNRDLRILILGLDSAGKTTILYRLQLGEVIQSAPTVGFNVETIKYKNLTFQVWDLGGQTSVRPYWRCYYADTTAVIFVVDSTDVQRMATCRSELQSLLAEDELKTAKLLVFANKQDLSGALDAAAVAEHLGLQSLKDRTWTIVKCSAKKGTGLEEGLDWLVNAIQQ